MNEPLSPDSFPSVGHSEIGRWAPVYLSPILHSPERFVVAVAVANDNGFHIEAANALSRLECLYGNAAETAIFAVEVALEELQLALAEKGVSALVDGVSVFTGISLGEVQVGEAPSLAEIGRIWMGALSSLYRYVPSSEEVAALQERGGREAQQDRLPVLVLNHVVTMSPDLGKYFADDIRSQKSRRSSRRAARISIDYAGPKFVANFATLGGAGAGAVDRIKRKMFDLKVRRDEEQTQLFGSREYEMLLYTPHSTSPLLTEVQSDRLGEAIQDLSDQSVREGFTLLALHDVPEIGARVLGAEAALN